MSMLLNFSGDRLSSNPTLPLFCGLPDLTEYLVREMMRSPLRSYDPNLIQDPTVYRYCLLFQWGYFLWKKVGFLLEIVVEKCICCEVKWVICSIIMTQYKTHCL
ncbi:hypothetical protein VIGAN_08362100 [Vigna angularis var. angularis]|uniref:Uncharacterized protein n=1 Tax=Vigna angularis var. angularis TaxID=157739 RepID=A0A0S3SUZ8_PHAAN|nr:hypothetical protein VIGAN_08362100 [Vigna angularis var. angularis]